MKQNEALELTIARKDLLYALTVAARAAGPYSRYNTEGLWAHGGLLLAETNGQLSVTATDGTRSIRVTVAANAMHPGMALVHGQRLLGVIKRADTAEIHLRVTRSVLEVAYGDFTIGLPDSGALAYSDIPATFDVGCASLITISGARLAGLVKLAGGTYMKEPTSRPVLHNVYMNAINDTLTVATTDGYQLSRVVEPFATGDLHFGPWLCAPELLHDLVRVIEKDGAAYIGCVNDDNGTPATIVARTRSAAGEVVMTTAMIDVKFPDFTQTIPRPGSTKVNVTLDRKAFLTALSALSPLTSAKVGRVRAEFTATTVTLTTDAEDMWGKAVVPCVADIPADSKPFTIAFNSFWLSAALARFATPTVTLQLTIPERPILMTSDSDNRDYLYLLMPMQG